MDVACQQFLGQGIAHGLLNQAAQRAGTVGGIVPTFGEPQSRGVGNVQSEASSGKATGQFVDLDINDAGQLLCRERLEDHHVVEAVDEFRLEVTLHSFHHLLWGATCPQVGSQDNDGVAEVHSPPLAVGEPTFVEHLQQHVEHLGVRLLHLIEQDHGVGTTAHGLRQLTALIVANISGRGTDEARN